jgi:acyl carrier protein
MTGAWAVYSVLKNVLVNELQSREEDITPAASCIEIGLDSLTVAELSIVLRSRLGIEIYDYELLELATVGDIARLMEQRRVATDGPADPRP